MKMAKRIAGSLLHIAALACFLLLYSPLYRKVGAYAASHDVAWLALLYEAAMALLPALYLRGVLAFLRRGTERVKMRLAVDPSGVLSTVLLIALGLWGRFSDALALTAGGVLAYYFTSLWLALLCCFHRVPCKEADVPQPVPAAAPATAPGASGAESSPLWNAHPAEAAPAAFDALRDDAAPKASPASIEVEMPAPDSANAKP